MTERSMGLAAVLGVATVVAFFLPFLDVGGLVTASGWDIVTHEHTPLSMRLVVAALPVGGLIMLGAGLSRAKWAPLACVGFGVSVLGYMAYKTLKLFLATTGIGLWIVVVVALVAIFGILLAPRRR